MNVLCSSDAMLNKMNEQSCYDPDREHGQLIDITVTISISTFTFFVIRVLRAEALSRCLHHRVNCGSPYRASEMATNSGERSCTAYYAAWTPIGYSALKQYIHPIGTLLQMWLHVVAPDGRLAVTPKTITPLMWRVRVESTMSIRKAELSPYHF